RRVREALSEVVVVVASQRAFLGVSALLFAASAALTTLWCASMSAMGEMPMPGGWTMSMAWMRMSGQTWPGAAASFLGMWVVMMAGSLQLTAWKARHLACCRQAPGRGRTLAADAGTAWRHGLRLGLHCSRCCAGLMAILLAIGVMDLRAMAVVAAAITVERLAPSGERVARAIGALVVGAGVFLIARAAGLG